MSRSDVSLNLKDQGVSLHVLSSRKEGKETPCGHQATQEGWQMLLSSVRRSRDDI